MRFGAAAALGVVMLACSTPDIGQAQPPVRAPRPAGTQAADLRTQLDLLLAEHVMIVAKESAAAVNHSDEYAAYTSLLVSNADDLSRVIGRAFGNSAAAQFAQAWNAQNGLLVDYAIGVVTHNDDKAKSAISDLTGKFAPQFAQLVSDLTRLPSESVKQMITLQALDDQAFIDGVFAGKFSAYYTDLHKAYAQTSRLGDALAHQIAFAFPDKFPGSTSDHAVDARVALNLLMQERSYLTTMVTDAAVNSRDAEKSGAIGALTGNSAAMKAMVQDQRFTQAWGQESATLETYATHSDDKTRKELIDNFIPQLASATGTPSALIAAHVSAAIRVIDDQRMKSSKAVANDDRAAATSMQPIADAAV